MSISVLILTKNEEINLPVCLNSLTWCDDIVVLDSFSNDRTTQIASDFGCRVVHRDFDNYANQRNFGLEGIEYKNQWVLMLDADEITPKDLVDEMGRRVREVPAHVSMFRMRRSDMFLGRWIRRSSGYPTWFGRLVRLGHVRVEREINEQYNTDGEVSLLDSHLVHYPFNKGFAAWFDKHNRYSSMEAEVSQREGTGMIEWKGLFSADPTERRRAVKQIVYAMPGRPVLMFLGLYVVRGGFLEGRAGFTFCMLRAIYEYMIDCKVRELRLRNAGLPL